jgi:hypothetical protein
MLKFSVQIFYQALFSHSFPFSNFPLAVLFPSVIIFPSKSFPHQKAKSQRQKASCPKAKAKSPSPSPSQKQKPLFCLQGSFINSSKWDAAVAMAGA